ncbi:hypothetical protein NKH41_29080, partial [Mesorhizobium sp. M1169]|uniref:hypothetical protein n=1 Tax=Mesorhizobium sp. M1169 TaxID=2957066 RepID=UPI0033358D7A
PQHVMLRGRGGGSFYNSHRLFWGGANSPPKLLGGLYPAGRAAASPATGLMSKHLAQLAALLDDALGE